MSSNSSRHWTLPPSTDATGTPFRYTTLLSSSAGTREPGLVIPARVERIAGREYDEPVVLVSAAHSAKTLYRFGDGVLLAHEIGDEPAPANLAASLGASIDSYKIAPARRVGLAHQ